MNHYYSENFVFLIILLNAFTLCIDEPVQVDPYFKTTIRGLNYAISAIFVIELLINVIISGFCNFLKGGLFNVFDFFIVVTIILSTGFEVIFRGDEADDS